MVEIITKTIFVLGIISASHYWTYHLGKKFYASPKHHEVFDLFHSVTPDLQELKKYNDVIALTLIGSLIFFPALITEALDKILLVMLLRSITILSTILPKYKEREDHEFKWVSFLTGHEYDKIFSGHTAVVLLITLIMYREVIISLPLLVFINGLNITLILVTRSHYSVDIVVACMITYFVHNGNYTLFRIDV
jgi:hypothetical protein